MRLLLRVTSSFVTAIIVVCNITAAAAAAAVGILPRVQPVCVHVCLRHVQASLAGTCLILCFAQLFCAVADVCALPQALRQHGHCFKRFRGICCGPRKQRA